MINVTASASGAASVQFKLDGANLGALLTSSTYLVSFNTTAYANGSHTLTAVAKDALGNSVTSAAVTVNINNQNLGANVGECANWQTNHPSWIFCDGFESGNFNSWSYYVPSALGHVSVNGVKPRSGSYAADIYYSSTTSNDINLYFDEANLNSDHFFVRGYVYFQAPDPGATMFGQRKVYYLKQSQAANDQFIMVLSSFTWQFPTSPGNVPGNIDLCSMWWYSGGSSSVNHYGTGSANNLHFNRWYSIELEVKLNTPGQSDGYINVWVDGVHDPGASPQNIAIRGPNTGLFNYVEVGRQMDPWDATSTYGILQTTDGSEHRYWDDLVISSSYIGPQAPSGVADVIPPDVPANLSAVAVSSSEVDLIWDASLDNVGTIGYYVYRDGKLIFSTPYTVFADKWLGSTSHNYTVAAYDAAGNVSAQSAAVHP